MRIAISTGGGDAPGLNAVIRAVVLSAHYRGWKSYGIQRGYEGLLSFNGVVPLGLPEVRGITHLGGTILGTTNRGNPFRYVTHNEQGEETEGDRSDDLVAAFQASGFDALVAIGGDGSLQISHDLWRRGLPVVCVPKTIDNDVSGTQRTFGFDTAVSTATDAIDKLHSTAESHDRVIVVELMGRYAGWITLYSGLSGSADVILDSRDPVRHREGVREDPQPGGRGTALQHRSRRRRRTAEGRVDRAARAPRRGHVGPPGRHRQQGGPRDRASYRQGDAHAGAGASPARRLAHHLRPAAGAPLRLRGGPGHRGPRIRHDGGPQRRRTSPGCRSRTSWAGPTTCRSTATPSAPRATWGSAWVTEPAYPATRTDDTVDVLHGEPIPDPYRWLENGDDPDTRDWTDRQNALTERYLAALPARASIRRRLDELLSIGALTVPAPAHGRYFYQRRDGRQNQPVVYVRDEVDGPDRVALDPNALDPAGTTALDWYYPSADGRLLAYGLSQNGSEQSVLHVLDVDAGTNLPDRIPRTRAADHAWLPDASGFYYTRYPGPGEVPDGEEHYHRAVYFHALGADPADDELVFRPAQKEYWPGVSLSPDGRWLLVSVARTFDQTDLYLGDRNAGEPMAPPLVPVAENLAASFDGEVAHGRLFLRTNLDAPTYRLFEVNPAHPARGHWREIVPARAEAVLEGIRVLGDRLALSYLERACSRLRLADLDGGLRHEVALPTLGSVFGLGAEWDGHELFYGFSSYTVPPSVYRIDLVTGEQTLWRRVEADVDPERFEVRQVSVPSRDGTAVTMFLVHRRDRPRSGDTPDLPHRLRRVQHQHDAGVLALAAPLARARWPRGHPQHPRRRRVRRGVAPGRDAGPEAEQLRRLRGGGRVARAGGIYPAGAAGGGGRLQRRTTHGRGADPAAGALRRSWCRFRCSTCCGTIGFSSRGSGFRNTAPPTIRRRSPGSGRTPPTTTSGRARPIPPCSSRPPRATPESIRCTPGR